MLKKLQKFKIDYILLATITALHYGRLQWNNFLVDPDSFYHAKMAQLIKQGIILKSLPWMQFSTLKENFVDHQFLYHLLIAPLNYYFDPLIAAKIATVFFAVLNVCVFYWLLKKLKIKYPLIFALLLITSFGLNWRLMAVKVNSLSLTMIWLSIYAIYKNKKYYLGLLSFIFVWLYSAWPMMIFLWLFYKLSIATKNYIQKQKLPKSNFIFDKTILYIILGIILGLIINPYWPHNLYFYWQQIIQIALINHGQDFSAGAEWHSLPINILISVMPHIFFMGVLMFAISIIRIKKLDRITIFSFILSFIFLLLTVKSARYLEYLVPFMIFFVASAISNSKDDFIKLKQYWLKLNLYIKIIIGTLFIIISSALLFCIYKNTWQINMPTELKANNLKNSSTWLKNNTAENSIIFNSSWDDWPQLFYHNDNNFYIVGLDYTFLFNHDKNLHQKHNAIMEGLEKNDIAKIIKNDFGSDYIITSKKERYSKLLKNLRNSTDLIEVYEDQEAIIYKVDL